METNVTDKSAASTVPGPATLNEYPIDRFVTYRLSRLQARLNSQAVHLLRKHGLTLIRWRIIVLLKDRGPSSAAELVRAFDFDKGLLSRNLKQMVEEGLLATSSDEKDARRHIVSLTPSGMQKFKEVRPMMKKRQDHLTESICGESIQVFFQSLDRLSEAARRRDF
jgi:DNA-binding MarR family transcriptional regulator